MGSKRVCSVADARYLDAWPVAIVSPPAAIPASGDPFSVYLDRPVYNLRPEMERQGLQGALQILDKHRIGVAIIAGVYPGLLTYLSERTPPERRFGPLWVFRIDDPGALGARPAERQR